MLERIGLPTAHAVRITLWNSYRKQNIKSLEIVQMRATRLVTALRNKPYQDRLKALDLPTLKFRRLRGDMIETYKVLSGIYHTSVAPVIPIISEHATRGHSLTRKPSYR